MNLENIEIRQIEEQDEKQIIDICYETGGENLKKIFPNPYLFGLLFCLYYVWYEKNNCFVAVDNKTGRVVGYIISSLDTTEQRKKFKFHMSKQLYENFRKLKKRSMKSRIFLHFIINRPTTNNQKRILKEYPAHLHIDIVPEFQRKGIGKKLIEHLEKYLKRMNIQGYHLEVDPKNIVGVSFYKKLRLELLNSNRFTLTFGKKMV